MKKYVYLFELDSVRKTDEEIITGQKALYNEIVRNGNIVVLTCNQLIDSRGFFSLLHNKDYYDNFIKLFQSGSICISQYGDIRTISQYLIDNISKNQDFIYSGWPLKSTQKRLLALIKRSLMYSDLTEIYDYLTNAKSDDEILDLFIEADRENHVSDTTFTADECREILDHLCYLLKTVLRLSPLNSIYINPKSDDEYQMSLAKYIKCALRLTPESDDRLWPDAKRIIETIVSLNGAKIDNITDRSKYHHAIKRLYETELEGGELPDKDAYQYAEAIIDICYNYQLEYSICNSSKHYNISELLSDDPESWTTFRLDFFYRLAQLWGDGSDRDIRFLAEETSDFDTFEKIRRVPDFERACRILDYSKKRTATSDEPAEVYRYEHELNKQRKKYKRKIKSSIYIRLLSALICIFVACCVEIMIQLLQNVLDSLNNFSFIVETLAFLVLTELITWWLSKISRGHLLPMSEAFTDIKLVASDWCTITFSKLKTYCSGSLENEDVPEKYNAGRHIEFVRSDQMKQYLSFRKNNASLFKGSDIYPIADLSDDNCDRNKVLKALARDEELFGRRYGVVYKSKFNTMVVDPIIDRRDSAVSYYPYERVVPTSGKDGAVMIPKCGDKFIMIEQYRHAIRAEQYSFPRGFADENESPEETATRELNEELNVKEISRINLLGRTAPDSGLTSSVVYVYLVEFAAPSPSIGHEGIKDAVYLSEEEVDGWIKAGKINDGFTLSAWTLLKSNKKSVI